MKKVVEMENVNKFLRVSVSYLGFIVFNLLVERNFVILEFFLLLYYKICV